MLIRHNRRTLFTIDAHQAPLTAVIGSSSRFISTGIAALNITPAERYLVKVLYFVVCLLHGPSLALATPQLKAYTRQKHKNNAASFHGAKGGAVPTLAHQNSGMIRIVPLNGQLSAGGQ